MTYPKALVSIQICHSRLKCLRIEASVKAFCKCMKASLAPEVRKSVSKKLAFTFNKFDFLDLADFSFLNLANFTTVDRFSILLPTSTLLALIILFGIS